jgi:hypothetical protein
LFISYVQPHKEVSRDTQLLVGFGLSCAAGINTAIFKAHSVQSASVAKAKEKFVPVDDILSKVGWSIMLIHLENIMTSQLSVMTNMHVRSEVVNKNLHYDFLKKFVYCFREAQSVSFEIFYLVMFCGNQII